MRSATIVGMIALLSCGSLSSRELISPPRGLEWGQGYEGVKATLSEDGLKLDKLKHEKNKPETLWFAKIKNMKLLDEKVDEAYAVFDSDTGLCAVLHGVAWDNEEHTNNMFESANKGRDKCWEYVQKANRGLAAKYGQPNRDDTEGTRGESIASGVKLEAEWNDADGDKVILAITRRKINAVIVRVDQYITALVYCTAGYVETMEATVADTGEL